MKNRKEDIEEKVHEAYLLCKDAFTPYNSSVTDILGKLEMHDKEEDAFLFMVNNFFLQKKQREVMANERYD